MADLSSVGVEIGVEPVDEGGIEVFNSARTGFLISDCFEGAVAAAANLRSGRAGSIVANG